MLREQIMERDGWRCRRCLSSICLSVHYVDGDKTNSDPSNLETLCGPCDLNAHRTLRVRRTYIKERQIEGVLSP